MSRGSRRCFRSERWRQVNGSAADEPFHCTHSLRPSTRLDRPQVPLFTSSVRIEPNLSALVARAQPTGPPSRYKTNEECKISKLWNTQEWKKIIHFLVATLQIASDSKNFTFVFVAVKTAHAKIEPPCCNLQVWELRTFDFKPTHNYFSCIVSIYSLLSPLSCLSHLKKVLGMLQAYCVCLSNNTRECITNSLAVFEGSKPVFTANAFAQETSPHVTRAGRLLSLILEQEAATVPLELLKSTQWSKRPGTQRQRQMVARTTAATYEI